MYDHGEDLALPTDSKARKELPLYSALIALFPLALAEVARVSVRGQKQHGTKGWDRKKSPDHLDCIARHLWDAGKQDHSANMAWRALANLQIELEAKRKPKKGRNVPK